jgi:predicted TIM-barrel fold metal-dependent hydrolase
MSLRLVKLTASVKTWQFGEHLNTRPYGFCIPHFHAPAVMLAVATVGIDHVVMGSDHPPVNVSLKKTVDTTQSLPLSMSDKQKILGGNAARLLKLS